MTGSVLVAKVQRDRKRVELDGTVRPGMAIDAGPKTEVVILALTSVGHLVDAAAVVARDLRARGWQVTVRPYRFQGVETVKTLPTTASAMVAAVVAGRVDADLPGHVVAARADQVAKPRRTRKPMIRWTSRRFRCDTCGVEKVTAALTQHQRRTGHSGRTFLDMRVIDKTVKGSERSETHRLNAQAPPDGW